MESRLVHVHLHPLISYAESCHVFGNTLCQKRRVVLSLFYSRSISPPNAPLPFSVSLQALELDGTRLTDQNDSSLGNLGSDFVSGSNERASSRSQPLEKVVGTPVCCKNLITREGGIDFPTDADHEIGGKDATGGRVRHDSGAVVIENNFVYMVYARRL